MARVLVEHGADVNRRDSEGKTVMMVRRCLLKLEGITDTSVLSSHVLSGPRTVDVCTTTHFTCAH